MNNIIELLKNGKVIAIPTDTVYGLICDATNKMSIDKVYDIKKRDKDKPLLIFVKDYKEALKYVEKPINNGAIEDLTDKYWPGSLTIIFKKKKDALTDINPTFDTIGIRVPNDNLLLNILSNVDFPLAQTSCNISGEEPYTYEEIKSKLIDKIDHIVPPKNETFCKVSSTIIDVTTGTIKLLRPGEVSEKEGFKS